MKTSLHQRHFLFLFALFISINLFAQSSSPREKHALIIVIGEYAPGTGLASISSMNDVGFVKKALLDQSFPEKNIEMVTNKQATRSGIVDAIKHLTSEVKGGDVVVIHISSHGSQIQDDNRDETDGLDEAVVAYDAPSRGASTYYDEDQKKYFRDDEFGTLINALRQKLGKEGDVLVLMDNCHSGTGTRGEAKVRGDKEPFVSAGFKAKPGIGEKNDGVFLEGSSARGDESNMAPYVVISAARAAELNFETKADDGTPIGSLSYAFSKVSLKLESNTTYRTLFSKILVIMNEKVPSQQPVMEGSGLDRSLFGGAYQAQKPYVELSRVVSDTVVRVKGGKLAGLDLGSKVDFYPSGTLDPSKAAKIAEGKVINADLYGADIRTSVSFGGSVSSKYWGFATETAFKIEPISFNVLTPKSNVLSVPVGQTFKDEESNKIKASLKGNELIRIGVDSPALVLRRGKETDDLVITSNGYVYRSFKNSSDYSEALGEAIRSYAQRTIILQDVSFPGYDLEAKLIPVVNGKSDSASLASKTRNGKLEIRAGDTVMVCVMNKGDFNVFFNILDIQPYGVINPIFPNSKKGVNVGELKVPERSAMLFPFKIAIAPPYGSEIFKVFASKDEINIEMIANSRGESTRGNFNSFEGLVSKSYGTKRGADLVVSKSDGMTMSVPFVIVK